MTDTFVTSLCEATVSVQKVFLWQRGKSPCFTLKLGVVMAEEKHALGELSLLTQLVNT